MVICFTWQTAINNRIQIWDLVGTPTYESTLGPTPPSFTSGTANNRFDDPVGVTVADDKLYVADKDNHRVQVYDVSTSGTPTYERTIGTTGYLKQTTPGSNNPKDWQ